MMTESAAPMPVAAFLIGGPQAPSSAATVPAAMRDSSFAALLLTATPPVPADTASGSLAPPAAPVLAVAVQAGPATPENFHPVPTRLQSDLASGDEPAIRPKPYADRPAATATAELDAPRPLQASGVDFVAPETIHSLPQPEAAVPATKEGLARNPSVPSENAADDKEIEPRLASPLAATRRKRPAPLARSPRESGDAGTVPIGLLIPPIAATRAPPSERGLAARDAGPAIPSSPSQFPAGDPALPRLPAGRQVETDLLTGLKIDRAPPIESGQLPALELPANLPARHERTASVILPAAANSAAPAGPAQGRLPSDPGLSIPSALAPPPVRLPSRRLPVFTEPAAPVSTSLPGSAAVPTALRADPPATGPSRPPETAPSQPGLPQRIDSHRLGPVDVAVDAQGSGVRVTLGLHHAAMPVVGADAPRLAADLLAQGHVLRSLQLDPPASEVAPQGAGPGTSTGHDRGHPDPRPHAPRPASSTPVMLRDSPAAPAVTDRYA